MTKRETKPATAAVKQLLFENTDVLREVGAVVLEMLEA
jgi:hypothetical protein